MGTRDGRSPRRRSGLAANRAQLDASPRRLSRRSRRHQQPRSVCPHLEKRRDPSTAQPDPQLQPQPPAPVRNAEPLGDMAPPAASAPLDAGAREAEALAPSDPKTHQSAPIGQKIDVRARWPMVLRRLHEINKPQVHTLLQKVAVEFIETNGQVLALPFRPNDFWLGKRLETTTKSENPRSAVSEVLGGQWSIRCVTIDEPSVRRGDLGRT